jgi:hypothetical protein
MLRFREQARSHRGSGVSGDFWRAGVSPFLQEVFSGAVIVDHPFQRAQPGSALGEENVVEA